MKKVIVSKDELWPVYGITKYDDSTYIAEFSEEELARIEACEKEFQAIQDLFEERIKPNPDRTVWCSHNDVVDGICTECKKPV